MKMDDMPMPKEIKKMMMKKMKGSKEKSDMIKKCMGHLEELVKINKQILAELKKIKRKHEEKRNKKKLGKRTS